MTEEERSVFVTVGTTSFDELVGSVAEENFMKVSTSCLDSKSLSPEGQSARALRSAVNYIRPYIR